MKQALGLSNAALGVAEVCRHGSLSPHSQHVPLQRVGARRWMESLMLVWGLCSAGTALVSNRARLHCTQSCSGVAEAGFAPGLILYRHTATERVSGQSLASVFMFTAGIGRDQRAMGSGLLPWMASWAAG